MNIAIPQKITVEVTNEEKEVLNKATKILKETYLDVFQFATAKGYSYFKCYDKETDSHYTINIYQLDEIAWKIQQVLDAVELVNYEIK